MELFEQWEFEGNVDMINAGMMQWIDGVARAQLRDTPGYSEKVEDSFNQCREVRELLRHRRLAKEQE
eukprot:7228083-Pyramimonas_sp.AAC.1